MTSAQIAEACRSALRARAVQGGLVCDDKGYVAAPQRNLIYSDCWDSIAADLEGGAGGELGTENGLRAKFCAAHSSSALAVNAFGPWRDDPSGLRLNGLGEFRTLRFEAPCSAGVRGTAPHLDVLIQGAGGVVAVESKCTEFLAPKAADFADAYGQLSDARRHSPWFQLITSKELASGFRHLDVGQLTKHYLGLAHTFPSGRVVLLYLFWEPSNANGVEPFVTHRNELAKLSGIVDGDRVEFRYQSYPALWDEWRRSEDKRMHDHASRLQERYLVEV